MYSDFMYIVKRGERQKEKERERGESERGGEERERKYAGPPQNIDNSVVDPSPHPTHRRHFYSFLSCEGARRRGDHTLRETRQKTL